MPLYGVLTLKNRTGSGFSHCRGVIEYGCTPSGGCTARSPAPSPRVPVGARLGVAEWGVPPRPSGAPLRRGFSCVDARMSAVRGKADVPRTWSELRFLANNGLSKIVCIGLNATPYHRPLF